MVNDVIPVLSTVPLVAMAQGVVQNREVVPIHETINSGPSTTGKVIEGYGLNKSLQSDMLAPSDMSKVKF
uniref:Uncharacterized protein n=1 Tax=uncultured archaeon MedDCM-OCT-S09-C50 TaxID=743102 RepID=D6PC68_9ARCH|nr:hypothetical protein [uncultured archaeon MedDCM-OCT-S09-C50]